MGGDDDATAARAARRRVWVGAAVVVALALGLGALWLLTPLRAAVSVDALAAAGARLRDSPLALGWVLAVYVVAALLFVPITPLLAATALVFDVATGLLYGLCASTLAAWVTYLLGKAVRRWRPTWLQGPRVQRLCARLQRSALATAFVARVLPVGSFTLFNIAAGAVPIALGPFLVGNALGLLPRMIAFAAVAGGVGRATREPRAANWLLLALAVVAAVVVLAWLRRRAARVTSARVR
jgi:uncharacterized membrane protein YdjX (TVP38/TMEM64 family)